MKTLVLTNLSNTQRESLAAARGGTVSGSFSQNCGVCRRGYRPQDLTPDPAQANKPTRLRQLVCPRCARLRAKPGDLRCTEKCNSVKNLGFSIVP